jgi:hypothetical protein
MTIEPPELVEPAVDREDDRREVQSCSCAVDLRTTTP